MVMMLVCRPCLIPSSTRVSYWGSLSVNVVWQTPPSGSFMQPHVGYFVCNHLAARRGEPEERNKNVQEELMRFTSE
ncbi:hypothetical protein BaRGS_00032075 [Batillaria attramentaria]|uniref:Secreted protein n=1 Tax=Batillaria attramentaria TaxID=370345 RepID=A0ABD0JPA3_9CAEN